MLILYVEARDKSQPRIQAVSVTIATNGCSGPGHILQRFVDMNLSDGWES